MLVGVSVNGLPLAEAPVVELFGPSELIYSSIEEGEDHVVGVFWFLFFCFCVFFLFNVFLVFFRGLLASERCARDVFGGGRRAGR